MKRVKDTIRLHTALAAGIALLLLCPAFTARAESIRVGGSDNKVRVVFQLPYNITPQETKQNNNLIVKFSNKVGQPIRIDDFFLINNIDYDGQTARIMLNDEFTYESFLLKKPSRWVIDITGTRPRALPCPIESIEAQTKTGGVSVTIQLADDAFPRIRQYNNMIYLIFDGDFDCNRALNRLHTIPNLEFAGTFGMQNRGTTFVFSATKDAAIEVTPLRLSSRIVLDILAMREMQPDERYIMALKAFSGGDTAACIDILEPHKLLLYPREQALLGRAYWDTAYPQGSPELLEEAIELMTDGINNMAPDPTRDQQMLILTKMLMLAERPNNMRKYVRYLKDSPEDKVAIEGHVLEIAMLNLQEKFDDAFVGNQRMLKAFERVPEELEAQYLGILGDTYMGLNAYDKAMQRYRSAMQADPEIFIHDPTLYGRMAEAAFKMEDFQTAHDLYIKAINLGHPGKRDRYLVRLGDTLHNLGDSKRALHIFAEVENISPRSDSNVIAKLRTANILTEQDLAQNDVLSDSTFYQVLDIYETIEIPSEEQESPLEAIVKVRIAQTYARHHDWNDSFAAYYKAWIDTKKNSPVHNYAMAEAQTSMLERIEVLFEKQDYEQIHELYRLYQDSFLSDIKDYRIIYFIGLSMFEQNNLEPAKELLSNYVANDSTYREKALWLLFKIDFEASDLAGALRWNTLYLADYPAGEWINAVKNARGDLLYRLGQLDEAAKFLQPLSRSRDEQGLNNLSKLADIYRRTGEAGLEAATLDRIISLKSSLQSPIIEKSLYLRAGQLKEAGNLNRARELYNSLIEEYPQSSYKWWAIYELAGLESASQNYQDAAALLNQVIQNSTNETLLSAARFALNNIALQGQVEAYNQKKSRFEGE